MTLFFEKKSKGLGFIFSPFVILLLFLLSLCSLSCKKGKSTLDKDYLLYEEQNNLLVYKRCKNSVLKLYSYYNNELKSTASAIVVKDKYILTAYHAIRGEKNKFILKTSNDELLDAELLIYDEQEDLALLRAKNKQNLLTEFSFADTEVQIGQKCISLSYPLDELYLSSGYVGGNLKTIRDKSGNLIGGMIASDSWTLPGSSGGALVDKHGNLIGLNYSVHDGKGTSIFLSFAYNSIFLKSMIDKMIREYKNSEKTIKASIDATFIPLTPLLKNHYNNPPTNGVIVGDVFVDGNCEEILIGGEEIIKGLKKGDYYIKTGGDIITKIANVDIYGLNDIWMALADKTPGENIDLTIFRNKDRKYINKTITLSKRKNNYKDQFIDIL